ncbi:diguanylate cyclase [Krasilnikovia sp. M28-CT-15]|uniref:GGDEF domain-containing protein n=1 Tax=Krasilnikovia sp. M28-CT-15 TaxID=3373540 RepID=UPI00387763C0
MTCSAPGAEELSAALLTMENMIVWDAEAGLAAATELERQAAALGDEALLVRARLCRICMEMRTGDLAGAQRQLHGIHDWAVAHDDRNMQARTHLNWANIQRLSGDVAKCLEHSVIAVELLDESATPYMLINHRTRLADALGLNGAMDAARMRYRQAEELARELDQGELLTMLLNNWAYTEYSSGEFPRAQEVAARLCEHAAEYGFELDPAALDTIGAIQIENGEYAAAEETMQACLAQYEAGFSDDADDLAEYQLTLARAQRGMGATEAAQASLDASRALCVERELHDVLVRVHQEQAEVHALRGEFAEAFAMHKAFFAARERLGSLQREAQAQTRLAMFETAEAREEAERFREQARRDPLTGLRNRRYVDEELPVLIAGDADLTVAIVDLDFFKRINDELSHDVGDQVLVRAARVLERELAATTPDGFVARLGGEEFLVVLPGTPVTAATARLDDLRRAVRGSGWCDITGELPVTVSIGVAGVHEATARNQPAVLAIADHNLYAAKHGGRDRVVAGRGPGHRPRAYRDRSPA